MKQNSLNMQPTERRIEVSVAEQLLRLFEGDELAGEWPVSTSKFGEGVEEGSFKTPLGKFRVSEEFGDGEPEVIACKLEASPTLPSEFDTVANDTLELTLRKLSSANAEEAEIGKGIFVVSVARAGWASLAGLAGGDVILKLNGKEVSSLDDMVEELAAIEERRDDYIVLFVKRGKLTRFVEIHPIWN